MDLVILYDILLVLGLALVVGLIFNRLHLPAMIGFILAGVLAGPYMFSLVRSPGQVDLMAEIGIILLLFCIGLEFSFRQLWEIRGLVLRGGIIQVVLASGLTTLITLLAGRPLPEAVLLGWIVSLSSTAVVLKSLAERGELESPHGKIIFGTLILQDLAAIPMMMALPFLAGAGGGAVAGDPLFLVLVKDALFVVILVTAAIWVLPWLMLQVARTRNNELFLLLVVSVCFGVAVMASYVGLSLAIGALLAGLLISGSEFSHQAVSLVVPFRDMFIAFFFVSIGMMIDPFFFFGHIWLVFLLLAGVVVLKFVTGMVAPAALGYPLRTMVLAGLALAQIGEFSFIISKNALDLGVLSPTVYQLFLIVAVSTMALAPLLISRGSSLASVICAWPVFRDTFPGRCELEPRKEAAIPEDHLVIIGYGVNGRNLAKAARIGQIPHVVIDLNPDLAGAATHEGETVVFGDATASGVLQHAGIGAARIAVVAINDPVATRRIVGLCRELNPSITLIARTRYVVEVPVLRKIGADVVVPEEFETSIEIFTRVLRTYGIGWDTIRPLVKEIRADSYQALREKGARTPGPGLNIPGLAVREVNVAEGSVFDGRSLGEVNLKKRYAVTVLAVRRADGTIPHPDGTCVLHGGDVVTLTGTEEKIQGALGLFLPGSYQGA